MSDFSTHSLTHSHIRADSGVTKQVGQVEQGKIEVETEAKITVSQESNMKHEANMNIADCGSELPREKSNCGTMPMHVDEPSDQPLHVVCCPSAFESVVEIKPNLHRTLEPMEVLDSLVTRPGTATMERCENLCQPCLSHEYNTMSMPGGMRSTSIKPKYPKATAEIPNASNMYQNASQNCQPLRNTTEGINDCNDYHVTITPTTHDASIGPTATTDATDNSSKGTGAAGTEATTKMVTKGPTDGCSPERYMAATGDMEYQIPPVCLNRNRSARKGPAQKCVGGEPKKASESENGSTWQVIAGRWRRVCGVATPSIKEMHYEAGSQQASKEENDVKEGEKDKANETTTTDYQSTGGNLSKCDGITPSGGKQYRCHHDGAQTDAFREIGPQVDNNKCTGCDNTDLYDKESMRRSTCQQNEKKAEAKDEDIEMDKKGKESDATSGRPELGTC